MALVLADGRSHLPDVINRFYKRDKGVAGWGEPIIWNGDSTGYLLSIDNPSGNHLILGGGIWYAQDSPGISQSVTHRMLSGAKTEWQNSGGTNSANIYHSNTNDVLRTDDSFQALGSFLLGSATSQFRGVVATAGTTELLLLGRSGEAAGNERYAVNADGRVSWGPGTAARDVTLARALVGATPALAVDRPAAPVALQGAFMVQRGGVTKGGLGTDAADRFAIVNATPTAVAAIDGNFLLVTAPSARGHASGTPVTNGNQLPLKLDAIVWDTDTMTDAANQRFKATRAGRYHITATVLYAGSALGTLRWSRLRANGTTILAEETDSNPAGTFGTAAIYHNLATTWSFAIGDYVEVLAYQDAVASMTVTGNMTMDFATP